jgi:hypothetical protein
VPAAHPIGKLAQRLGVDSGNPAGDDLESAAFADFLTGAIAGRRA